MRALLDINVLLALLDADHVDHRRAQDWISGQIQRGWASCALTQNGFVRIISQPKYPSPILPSEAVELLRRATSTEHHEFWPCSISLLEADRINANHLQGPRQVTDIYLLALAAEHGGRFRYIRPLHSSVGGPRSQASKPCSDLTRSGEAVPSLPRSLAVLLTLILAAASAAQNGAILDKIPEHPDRGARYVIYLHGRIIEDQGPRPTHEQWGIYEYRNILETLASAGTVISEQRRSGTDMDQFAEHVAGQVRTLIAAGVPPEHITVIGFSKGGGIAVRTSARLKNDKVNFVFLAACSGSADLDVHGRVLSIYEASDDIGRSCAPLFARSKSPGERKEVRIETGGGHGAFYRPRQEWTTPVLAWTKR